MIVLFIICIILFQTADIDSTVIDVITEISDQRNKPIVCCCSGGAYSNLHMRLLEEGGVPTFDTLHAAAESIAGVTRYKEFRGGVCLS